MRALGAVLAVLLCALALPSEARRAREPVAPEPPAAPAAPPTGFAGATIELVDDPVFGRKVAVYRAGKTGGEPVVLVHGLGQNGARDWAGLIPELAKAGHEVLALDLPGFGQSGGGDAGYSPAKYAEVLEKVIAPRTENRSFTLVGHSMGGAICLGYAAAHPERIKRLVLVDMAGVLYGPVYADALARGAMASKGVPASAFDSVLRNLLGKVEGMPLDKQMILDVPAMRRKFLRGDPNTIAAFALGNTDFSEALRGIRAPTLLVWGEDDPIAPLRTGQMAASLIPGARLAVLPGVGHVPMTQDTDAFNRIILDELSGKTALHAFAATWDAPPAASAPARKCDREDGKRFSGDIAALTILQCKDVDVSHARIGELRILDSEVRLVDTRIGGGIYALRSKLELTAGSVAGGVKLDGAELDAAGTRFEGGDTLVENAGRVPVTLRFSVVQARRGTKEGYVHAFVTVAPGERW